MSRKGARERIDILAGRREHLAERVRGRPREAFSYDRAELAALTWAIRVLENALATDALAELEQMTPSWMTD